MATQQLADRARVNRRPPFTGALGIAADIAVCANLLLTATLVSTAIVGAGVPSAPILSRTYRSSRASKPDTDMNFQHLCLGKTVVLTVDESPQQL